MDNLEAFIALKGEGLSYSQIAGKLGISKDAVARLSKKAAFQGLLGTKPVLPGFSIAGTSTQLGPDGELQREWIRQKPEAGEEFVIPDGHIVKGVSALVDPDGRAVAKWIKTREGVDPLAAVEAIKQAFLDYPGAAEPVPAPDISDEDLLTLLPCGDWHLGMYAWREDAAENWDLKKAERTISRAIDDLIERSPMSGEIIVLGGGDLLHSDNQENRTARSGNALDVDGRYSRVLGTACLLMARTGAAALRKARRVTMRILKGNHDEHSAIAVAYFLLAWFRNEPRVTVDVDPSLFFWRRFGLVMLGSTHGHTVKIKEMPSIMAHRRAEDWGATRFRYIHGFHLHHTEKLATEGGGVISEIHQTPIPQDAWHFGNGFISGRSMHSITYHRDFGEISRSRVAILSEDSLPNSCSDENPQKTEEG